MTTRIDKEMALPEGEHLAKVLVSIGPELVRFEGNAVMVIVLTEQEGGTHVNGGYFGPVEGIGMSAAHALRLCQEKGALPVAFYWFGRSHLEKEEEDGT